MCRNDSVHVAIAPRVPLRSAEPPPPGRSRDRRWRHARHLLGDDGGRASGRRGVGTSGSPRQYARRELRAPYARPGVCGDSCRPHWCAVRDPRRATDVTACNTQLRRSAGVWPQPLQLRATIGNGEQLFVQVTRADLPAQRDLEFTVTASCNVSILLGGKRGTPRLMCEAETSGWGADEIECGITVDGNRAAPHQQ